MKKEKKTACAALTLECEICRLNVASTASAVDESRPRTRYFATPDGDWSARLMSISKRAAEMQPPRMMIEPER